MAELGKVEPGDRDRPAAHAPARLAGWVRRAAGRLSVRLFVGLLAAFSLCGVLVYGIVSWAFPYGFDSVVAAREAGAADVMQGDGVSTWTFAEAGGDPPGTGAAVSITVDAQRAAIEDTFVTLLVADDRRHRGAVRGGGVAVQPADHPPRCSRPTVGWPSSTAARVRQ